MSNELEQYKFCIAADCELEVASNANSCHNNGRIRNTLNNTLITHTQTHTHTHTHSRLTAHCPGLPGWAGTRKVKPIWILLKQQTVSGRGISGAICKAAPRSRQITTSALHHSVFYRPDALSATQPTASKHWRQIKAGRLVGVEFNAPLDTI